ncbi:J domain-containing protein [Novosphingobium terrae]|uniref:J domain-containing protein n=1 Tax=Novosphingobium terrae TaxID=2726189 RepID=UPI00197FFE86|nr:J domain-containing protein [Novosphingobium terrae]
MKHDRFHGRVKGNARPCDWPDCPNEGEFRAPGLRPSGFDGPGDYRWFCLDHIRAFNAGYDYFEGMSAEEIWQAQSPIHGWASEQRAFRPTAGVDDAPRWADYADPLEAIAARARGFSKARHAQANPAQRADGRPVTPEERRALELLELGIDADRRQLRSRYSDLVHRYHPDRNGGDRSHEAKLQQVVEAYQLLRKAAAFS